MIPAKTDRIIRPQFTENALVEIMVFDEYLPKFNVRIKH